MYLTLYIKDKDKSASIIYDTKIAQPLSVSVTPFYNYFMFDTLLDSLKAADFISKHATNIIISIKKESYYFLNIKVI